MSTKTLIGDLEFKLNDETDILPGILWEEVYTLIKKTPEENKTLEENIREKIEELNKLLQNTHSKALDLYVSPLIEKPPNDSSKIETYQKLKIIF
jgi:hypothetical protein